MQVLSIAEWTADMNEHERRAADRLERFRHPGSSHPVFDFLFEYYPVRPSHLKRWHPGIDTALQGNAPQASWRDYHETGDGITVDVKSFMRRRGVSIDFILDLLRRSSTNPVHFDCFGLHEWAMVYHTDSPRHDLPLRLGAEGTNRIVDTHSLKCTHYDAFRFFTQPARALNLTVLNREGQPVHDQPGCVHVTMDLYKWAWKLGPLAPGDLFLDCLDLAIDARILDMEASPYDCRHWGLGVVPIETPEGKATYVKRQRGLAQRAQPLRERLVAVIERAYSQLH
ncbi:3-methyladenine DNA glycosylase [Corynebacterium macginleyi]|nr:3-methyladenine DNA glycosylase [Corynebacterium macginleyi]